MASKPDSKTKPKSRISKSLKTIAELAASKDLGCIAQLGLLEDSLDEGFRYRLCVLFESRVGFEKVADHLEMFESLSEASVLRVVGDLLIRVSFGSNEDVRAFQNLSKGIFWDDVLRGFGEFDYSDEGWRELKETKVISNRSKLPELKKFRFG